MSEYEKLLASVRRAPVKADYLALRMAYARSPNFNPYLNGLHTPARLRQALQAEDPQQVIVAVEEALESDYLDIEGHIIAMHYYHKLSRPVKATFHDLFAQGLLDSIMTVDGRSLETAFTVLSIREEYAVMAVMGFKVHSQRKLYHDKCNYDILSTQHPTTGEELEFIFNIDLMRTAFKFIPPDEK